MQVHTHKHIHFLISLQQAEVPTSKFLITSTLITQAILNTSHDLLYYHTSRRRADDAGQTPHLPVPQNTHHINTEKKKNTTGLHVCFKVLLLVSTYISFKTLLLVSFFFRFSFFSAFCLFLSIIKASPVFILAVLVCFNGLWFCEYFWKLCTHLKLNKPCRTNFISAAGLQYHQSHVHQRLYLYGLTIWMLWEKTSHFRIFNLIYNNVE